MNGTDFDARDIMENCLNFPNFIMSRASKSVPFIHLS